MQWLCITIYENRLIKVWLELTGLFLKTGQAITPGLKIHCTDFLRDLKRGV